MDKVKLLAIYLVQRYETLTKSGFNSDELKLQKLMYFLQRHSLAFQNKPLFEENFEGWKHGPVLVSLRHFFDEFLIDSKFLDEIAEVEKFLIDLIIMEYGQYDAWKLRDLSHNEISWINSRKGLDDNQIGNNTLKLEDIIEDAKKINLYNSNYYDIFSDDDYLTLEEEKELSQLENGPFYNFNDLLLEMGTN